MRPIKNNIIIEPIETVETKGGIIIKATETERLTAKVIAVGEGTKRNPMLVKVGQEIVYLNNVGKPLEFEGIRYLLINERHVVGIL